IRSSNILVRNHANAKIIVVAKNNKVKTSRVQTVNKNTINDLTILYLNITPTKHSVNPSVQTPSTRKLIGFNYNGNPRDLS
ncbi:hypothetical protein M8C21_013901, partial [Ambrosia artemisiifolia]